MRTDNGETINAETTISTVNSSSHAPGPPPVPGATWVEEYERSTGHVGGYWRGPNGERIDAVEYDAASMSASSPVLDKKAERPENSTRLTGKELYHVLPEELRAPENLAGHAYQEASRWNSVFNGENDGPVLNPDEVISPLQDTIRGVPLDELNNGDSEPSKHHYTEEQANAILSDYYDKRAAAEQKMRDLTWKFYSRPARDANLSYDPIRALGWQTRMLSDEITWMREREGGTLDDPNDKPWVHKPFTSAPPAFWDRDLEHDGIVKVCRKVTVLQGRSSRDAYSMASSVESSVRAGEDKICASEGRDPTVEESKKLTADALRSLMKSRSTVGEVVGIDIETTGGSPTRDWVVDAGWLRTDLHDPEEKLYGDNRRSYGVSETRGQLGNPFEELTGISAESLKGKKSLAFDEDAQREILGELTSGVPFVAHNARFEDKFFMQNIEGYAEAKRAGRVKIIDSRDMSQWLDEYDGKKGNSLEQYARRWGTLDPKTDKERHLGFEDSEIMLKAMGRHLRTITPQD